MTKSQQQSPASLICVGEITSAHGIKGALKLKVFTANAEDITAYGALVDEQGKTYDLSIVRLVSGDSLIAMLKGIDNRTAAEALRGIKLYISRTQLPEPEEDEYYHTDLIGMTVESTDGELVGTIKSVQNHGAGDFLEIMTSTGAMITIPFTKEAVPQVRLSDRKVIVISKKLL